MLYVLVHQVISKQARHSTGDVQSRIVVIYLYLICVIYFFAQASNFTCGTVSWGGFMMGTYV